MADDDHGDFLISARSVPAASAQNELLDIFDYRWQNGGETEEAFLEESVSVLGSSQKIFQARCDIFQVRNQSIDDALEAVCWERLWDEKDQDNSILTTDEHTPRAFPFIEDDWDFADAPVWYEGGLGKTGRPIPTASLTMPLSQNIPRRSKFIDSDNPDVGEDLDLPDYDRPGLRPQDFGFIPPRLLPQRAPVPTTREENITVKLGNWEVPYTVIKPNADYRDIPSPIMLPESPSQRRKKPSVQEFWKGPQRREFVKACVETQSVIKTKRRDDSWSPDVTYKTTLPPSLDLKIPKRAVNRMNHPSDSDVSFLSLGSPLDTVPNSRSSSINEHVLKASPAARILPTSRASSSVTSSCNNPPSSKYSPGTDECRDQSRQRKGKIRAPIILSVDAPLGNDLSWSELPSPRSESSTKSFGGVFALDEDLN